MGLIKTLIPACPLDKQPALAFCLPRAIAGRLVSVNDLVTRAMNSELKSYSPSMKIDFCLHPP